MKNYDLIIIGGGPAGLTAGMYGARSALKTLIIERAMPGGQAATTYEIANYPGFPGGVSGTDLAMKMYEQAQEHGAEFISGEITKINLEDKVKRIVVDGTAYQAKTVILATGVEPRKLGVDGEDKFRGRGVSYCATCDGAFFRGKKVIVVGGGDAAVEEAIYLTRFASNVTIIHRRDQLRAHKAAQDKAFANPKIDFIWNSVVEEIIGEDSVVGVKLKNRETSKVSDLACDGIFVYIGQNPVTELFPASLNLSPDGYVITDEYLRTNIPGVFAAGDVRKTVLRQLVTAVADGAVAAVSALKYLEEQE